MKRLLALFLFTVSLSLTSCGGTLVQPGPCEPYCLQSDAFPRTFSPDRPAEYSFIISGTGAALKEFEILHTKPMHVIVVRKDLQYFEHLHPAFDASTGRFALDDLTFPTSGAYRIFANFAPKNGEATVAYEDISVGMGNPQEPLGEDSRSATVEGYTIGLETAGLLEGNQASLNFNIAKDGERVALQEYLGALGHVIILSEGSLDFLHVHPIDEMVPEGMATFHAHFAKAGRYRVFAEFQVDGKVRTSSFTITVPPASAYEEMIHSEHH